MINKHKNENPTIISHICYINSALGPGIFTSTHTTRIHIQTMQKCRWHNILFRSFYNFIFVLLSHFYAIHSVLHLECCITVSFLLFWDYASSQQQQQQQQKHGKKYSWITFAACNAYQSIKITYSICCHSFNSKLEAATFFITMLSHITDYVTQMSEEEKGIEQLWQSQG